MENTVSGLRPALFVALLSLSLSKPITAQVEPSRLQAGTRIRLTVVDTIDPATGLPHYVFLRAAVARISDSALVIARETSPGLDRPDTMHFVFGRVVDGEAYSGLRRHKLRGGAVGLVAGAIGGFFVGDAGRKGSSYCYYVGTRVECGWRGSTRDKRPATSALFGAAGLLLGGTIGHFVRTERWDRIHFSVRYEYGMAR